MLDKAAADAGKKSWCLTHTHALDDLPLVKQVYPSAKYICLHRHCMDFLHSALDQLRYNWHACNLYNQISARDPMNVIDSAAAYW
jgi:protein-tyrosine sulfotransferase